MFLYRASRGKLYAFNKGELYAPTNGPPKCLWQRLHLLLWAGSQAAREKTTVSGVSNCLNKGVVFRFYTQFKHATAGRIILTGGPRVGDPSSSLLLGQRRALLDCQENSKIQSLPGIEPLLPVSFLNAQPRIIAYEKFIVINHSTSQMISSCNNSPDPTRRAHSFYRQLRVGPQAVRVSNRK